MFDRKRRAPALEQREGRTGRPSRMKSGTALAAADGLLERAPRGELGDGCRGNRHLLAGVARVDSLALGAILRRELPETGEGHVLATPERIGDRVEHRVDRLGGIAPAQAASLSDRVNELLLSHVLSPPVDDPRTAWAP